MGSLEAQSALTGLMPDERVRGAFYLASLGSCVKMEQVMKLDRLTNSCSNQGQLGCVL